MKNIVSEDEPKFIDFTATMKMDNFQLFNIKQGVKIFMI